MAPLFKNKYIIIIISIFIVNCTSNTESLDQNSENIEEPTENVEEVTLNVVEIALDIKAELGEGALWNYRTQELYWVDINGKKLHIYNPLTKQNNSFTTPSKIGTVVPKNEDEVLIALEDGVYVMDLNTGNTALFSNMASVLPNSRLNDGKCDSSGKFWVGSMQNSQETGKANLYAIGATGTYDLKIDNVTVSNGITWSLNETIMYYIDTPTSKIKAYDYNSTTGEISNGRVVVSIPTSLGFPDGMTIDAEGMLWVGMWNGNAVIRFNPITGNVMSKIEIPAHNITSCAFGGENLETLYITTASIDMTAAEKVMYPKAGAIFKVNPGVKGVNCNFFKTN